jgi:hypothetical protein
MATPRPIIGSMRSAKRELVIEIESGPDPLNGHIRDETGTRRQFAGWLGFASALGLALGEDTGESRRHSAAEREDEPRASQATTDRPQRIAGRGGTSRT